MAWYANGAAVRQIDAATYDAWVSAGNPKAAGWTPIADPPTAAHQWDGVQWLAPEPPAPVVPQQVTRRQFYRALLAAGWFGATQAAIDAAVAQIIATLPEPPREAARIDWAQSNDFLRTNPMLVSMLPAVGKTEADLDALFIAAATIA